MANEKDLALELTDDELDDVAGGTQYTGYGSAANANAAMGYRASKLDAMRQAGGGGEIVSQGRLEDGTYFTTIERSMDGLIDAVNSAVGGAGVDGTAANASGEAGVAE